MRAAVIVAFFVVVGCGSAQGAVRSAAERDTPVPAGEPRAELSVTVDLEPAQDCEERFDLALYRDRGIDLVTWDDAVGRCMGRTVTIRYLSAKLTKDALMQQLEKLSQKVSE
jgi:hypothetical protein